MVDEKRWGQTGGRSYKFDRLADTDKWLLLGEHTMFKHAVCETFDMYEDGSGWDPAVEPSALPLESDVGIEKKLEDMVIDRTENPNGAQTQYTVFSYFLLNFSF